MKTTTWWQSRCNFWISFLKTRQWSLLASFPPFLSGFPHELSSFSHISHFVLSSFFSASRLDRMYNKKYLLTRRLSSEIHSSSQIFSCNLAPIQNRTYLVSNYNATHLCINISLLQNYKKSCFDRKLNFEQISNEFWWIIIWCAIDELVHRCKIKLDGVPRMRCATKASWYVANISLATISPSFFQLRAFYIDVIT